VIAFRVGWFTYAVAALSSLVAPLVSLALYVLVIAYFLIPRGADTDLDIQDEADETTVD
jgi:hypothetical protein